LNLKEALKVCGSRCNGYRIDLFAGFRFLDLDESLRVNENVVLGTGRPVRPAARNPALSSGLLQHA